MDHTPHDAREMSQTDVLRAELDVLRAEHAELKAAIEELQDQPRPDPLALQRLKKRKLALKDRIAAIEDRLLPDIIA